ncbi:MAG: hypothetical protein HYV08_01230 [Deltaproteobacteria bacterium]|nr:hypothetical protein [Deltaproteobacteria bacterium]
MSRPLLAFVHLISATLYLGGWVMLGAIAVPALRRGLNSEEFRTALAAVLRLLHPFIYACFGVVVLTGAVVYYQTRGLVTGEPLVRLFQLLGAKLFLVFVATMTSGYQVFAVGREVIFWEYDEETRKEEGYRRVLRRLQIWTGVNILVALGILYLGYLMARP